MRIQLTQTAVKKRWLMLTPRNTLR